MSINYLPLPSPQMVPDRESWDLMFFVPYQLRLQLLGWWLVTFWCVCWVPGSFCSCTSWGPKTNGRVVCGKRLNLLLLWCTFNAIQTYYYYQSFPIFLPTSRNLSEHERFLSFYIINKTTICGIVPSENKRYSFLHVLCLWNAVRPWSVTTEPTASSIVITTYQWSVSCHDTYLARLHRGMTIHPDNKSARSHKKKYNKWLSSSLFAMRANMWG